MEYIDNSSLANTIDNVSEALLFELDITENEKMNIADFLIGRHKAPDAYANTFTPTTSDEKTAYVLFTGEKVKSRAGKFHIIGEEAIRILRKLNMNTPEAKIALAEADQGIQQQIDANWQKQRYPYGTYCCKTCSTAYWLNLSSRDRNNNTDILLAGLEYLKQNREEKGTWKSFHYFYTLYTLNEIDPDLSMEEMRFASRSILRWIKRKPLEENRYTMRRYFIGESILKKCKA